MGKETITKGPYSGEIKANYYSISLLKARHRIFCAFGFSLMSQNYNSKIFNFLSTISDLLMGILFFCILNMFKEFKWIMLKVYIKHNMDHHEITLPSHIRNCELKSQLTFQKLNMKKYVHLPFYVIGEKFTCVMIVFISHIHYILHHSI